MSEKMQQHEKVATEVGQFYRGGYRVVIELDPDEDSIMAYHPTLGKYAAYGLGHTVNEALTNLDGCREALLEALPYFGDEIPPHDERKQSE